LRIHEFCRGLRDACRRRIDRLRTGKEIRSIHAFLNIRNLSLFTACTTLLPQPLEDKSRQESLCLQFGIGFILFDPTVKDFRFDIRVRAQRFSPDMFYVNEFADRLRNLSPDKFRRLFG